METFTHTINADTFKSYCERAGQPFSARNLAKISGLSYPTVLNSINGKSPPRFETAITLLLSLGVTVEEINAMPLGDLLPIEVAE